VGVLVPVEVGVRVEELEGVEDSELVVEGVPEAEGGIKKGGVSEGVAVPVRV